MKKQVSRHGTQAGQQTSTEHYKKLSNYKELKVIKDNISKDLEYIYNNNIWNLKKRFEDLTTHFNQLGVSTEIAWNNGVLYLDTKNPLAIRTTSLTKLLKGEYKAIATDRPNTIGTEKTYGTRIKFFTSNFEPFNQFKGQEDLSWVLQYNRLLLLEILKYHNSKNNSIIALNNDLKCIIRVIKLILENPNHELRWKYSALQISLADLERLKDDKNKITTAQEIKSFIPYEQLMDIVDNLENNYNKELEKLSPQLRNDGSKHSNQLFQLNQLLIAVAINVLDYPSRLDKYEMDIIKNKSEAKENKCYIIYENTNPVITFFFNNNKKHHKPLDYKLDAEPILGLNRRLNEIIKKSLILYPRNHLFLKKNSWNTTTHKSIQAQSVADWISNLISNKSLGVATFRSAFVSYYYPSSSNDEKALMALRMRTSLGEINRSYLKYYRSPEELVKVKIEPSQQLKDKARSGTNDNPIIIVKDEPLQSISYYDIMRNNPLINDYEVIRNVKQITIQERRRLNAIEWYKKNREHHLKKTNELNKSPETYRRRYIRDLNNGIMDITKIKKETIDKYNIRKGDDGLYY